MLITSIPFCEKLPAKIGIFFDIQYIYALFSCWFVENLRFFDRIFLFDFQNHNPQFITKYVSRWFSDVCDFWPIFQDLKHRSKNYNFRNGIFLDYFGYVPRKTEKRQRSLIEIGLYPLPPNRTILFLLDGARSVTTKEKTAV